MALFFVFALAAVIVAALVITPLRRLKQRRALAGRPFPRRWRQLLRRRWWLYLTLPPDVRRRLQRQLQVMMAETRIYGCNGLTPTEEMKLLILAQAGLLYHNISRDRLADFPNVLLYPQAFVREEEAADELGLVSRRRHVLLGESWETGKVILSWSDIEQDLTQLDGHNLVMHEYAHQIDGQDGVMNGAPLLPSDHLYQSWSTSMEVAYRDLCVRAESGKAPLDPYAGTNPAEFFAVVTETFFTQPERLHREYPDVYRLLTQFYRQEPLDWQLPGGGA